ncbi:class C beta-lactamase [Stutzerimonas azotifigens]|uniref:Beta-lactamase n=1 Tax=Stutzerimonas azotifigens TaxID=291995 RepID=A0ABR5YWI5_9GAMM|nr:class C beta-lactamase [Stutzerimonas azotifigens]MBA1272282.1 beta-lactamase [Stutzerimonas azotifigens]
MHPLARVSARAFLTCGLTIGFALADEPPLATQIEQQARAAMAQHGIDGLAIAITVDGRRQYHHYGVASRETAQPVTENTLFEVGSVSKVFTATLAAYAQAQGRLSLDDKITTHLPQLRGSAFDDVSLLELATHTNGGLPLQLPDEVDSEEALLAYFRTWRPAHAPGSQRTYGNPGMGLLGMATAASLDEPYAQALEQRLLPALGMADSYLQVPAVAQPRYAQGYNRDDEPVRLNPGLLGDEAYGVKSTSRDLLRLVEVNLGIAHVDDDLRRAIARTHTGYFAVGPMTQDLVWEQYPYPVALDALLEGNSSTMAYQSNPARRLDPPQAAREQVWLNKTGSTNGFGAYVALVPSEKIGLVLLANRNFPIEARIRLAHGIIEALLRTRLTEPEAISTARSAR